MPPLELILIFSFIAFIYASVGFGGGSSYLAVLALYALPFKEIRLLALICNIIVVTGGTILFIQRKEVEWRRIIPLVLTSVPMAFAGAMLKISQQTFFVVLGISLLVASGLLWVKTKSADMEKEKERKSSVWKDGGIGGAIGFLSGMVGIGGGIFLSPLLNLMHWSTPRKIAATASFFILANSVSGILGQLTQLPPGLNYKQIVILCTAVFVGGQLGSRLGSNRFNPLLIRRITAVLVFVAGLEVLIKHLPFFK